MNHNGKENFFSKYRGLTEEEYNLEMLYAQKIIHGKLHKIRTNINVIKWLLASMIAVGVVVIVLMMRG